MNKVKLLFEGKRVYRFLLFISLWLSVAMGQANAGLIPTGVGDVMLDVDTTGAEPSLLGARNIDVFGTGELYDVSFVDGPFTDIFVDESGLDALDEASATSFAQALLDFVLIDVPVGNFDSITRLTFGCQNNFGCQVVIPFSFRLFDPAAPFLGNVFDFLTASNGNSNGFEDSVTSAGFVFSSFGTTFQSGRVFADFSLSSSSPAQDVPEPSVILFMMLTLACFLWMNRRTIKNK